MARLYLDFETKSKAAISVGPTAYAQDPTTQVLCAAWAIDDGPIQHWTPAESQPKEWRQEGLTLVAHNIEFECNILHHTLDFTLCFEKLSDTAARAAAYGWPRSLEDIGLYIGHRKMKINFRTATLSQLMEYCANDVHVLRKIDKLIPELSETEHRVWLATLYMNSLGIPVDREAAELIFRRFVEAKAQIPRILSSLTNGEITSPHQSQRFKAWLKKKGYEVDDMLADTVKHILTLNPPEDVAAVLELRQAGAKSAGNKFGYIMDAAVEAKHNGVPRHYRVHDSFIYCGALTGRWTGSGLQPHNLPRECSNDWERDYAVIVSGQHVLKFAKGLVRGCVCAPSGKTLIWADFASIEYVVLTWLAQDKEQLDAFEKGADQYRTLASKLYKVPYDQVTKEQRFMGKVAILGCGYGMGATKFLSVAQQWGASITAADAKSAVDTYRKVNHRVVELWGRLEKAAAAAFSHSVTAVTVNAKACIRFVKEGEALCCELPSGRVIRYHNAKREDGGISYDNPRGGRGILYRGTLIENVVQAIARDLIALPMLKTEPVMAVHDELVWEAWEHDADYAAKFYKRIMEERPSWGYDIPIRCEVTVARRYSK